MLEPFGVASTKELAERDLDALIKRLEDLPREKAKETPPSVRRLRSIVIIEAEHYLQIKVSSKGAWERLNALMMDKRVAGKLIWEMTDEELTATANKLRLMGRKKAKKQDDENEIAKQN